MLPGWLFHSYVFGKSLLDIALYVPVMPLQKHSYWSCYATIEFELYFTHVCMLSEISHLIS